MRAFLQRLTAPPAQILQTLQPSPYTVSYTVSTRRVPKTIFTRVASHVGLLLRTVVGLLAALLLWLKSQLQVTRTGHILLGVLNRPRTHQLFEFVDGCQWTYLAPCVLLVFMLVFRRNYAGTST
jgi:phosphatidylinositol glycan class H protein